GRRRGGSGGNGAGAWWVGAVSAGAGWVGAGSAGAWWVGAGSAGAPWVGFRRRGSVAEQVPVTGTATARSPRSGAHNIAAAAALRHHNDETTVCTVHGRHMDSDSTGPRGGEARWPARPGESLEAVTR